MSRRAPHARAPPPAPAPRSHPRTAPASPRSPERHRLLAHLPPTRAPSCPSRAPPAPPPPRGPLCLGGLSASSPPPPPRRPKRQQAPEAAAPGRLPNPTPPHPTLGYAQATGGPRRTRRVTGTHEPQRQAASLNFAAGPEPPAAPRISPSRPWAHPLADPAAGDRVARSPTHQQVRGPRPEARREGKAAPPTPAATGCRSGSQRPAAPRRLRRGAGLRRRSRLPAPAEGAELQGGPEGGSHARPNPLVNMAPGP